MKEISPSFQIMDSVDGKHLLESIEKAGRICYKSEQLITEDSAADFVRRIISHKHESVLEHEKITVKVICDRGVSHEIVRHRIASYSQESTRYCNYAAEKFGKELTFIRPSFWSSDCDDYYTVWKKSMELAEQSYLKLIALGAKPEEARSVLPNSLKTEIVITMNLREWRHFFRLRTSDRAHPQIREIACSILQRFRELIPAVFEDI